MNNRLLWLKMTAGQEVVIEEWSYHDRILSGIDPLFPLLSPAYLTLEIRLKAFSAI
jgi:hypothetical protein